MMDKISIQEIATVLIEKNGLKRKEAEQFVLTMFDLIKESLATDRVVKIKGLGTFKVVDIEARESVNVNTGERVLIEGHDKITFTPDNTMKELVNKPFSQFETVVLNEGITFDDMPETEEDKSDSLEIQDVPEIPEVKDSASEAEPEPTPVPVSEPETESEPVATFFESEVNTDNSLEETTEQPKEETPREKTPREETEDDNNEETKEEYMSKKMTYISLAIAILACVLCFAGGYYFGSNVGNESVSVIDTLDSKVTTEVIDTVTTDSVKSEIEAVAEEKTVEEAKAKPELKVDSKVEPKAEPKQEPKPEVNTEPKQETKTSASPDKYDQMDSRVRTGAYRIVGNDYSTKVKAGETLAKIARRTLGPDMECYIEVFNGIRSSVELKEGQSIMIPKLELKKKKKN